MSDHRLIEMFSDIGFFELDPKGKVRDWSNAASKLLGISSDEVIGRPILELGVHLDADAVASSLDLAARAGRAEIFGWVKRKDGSRFWANELTLAIRDDAGAVTGFARVVRDVTSWKAAEDDRDRIFTLSSDLICVANFEGTFTRVNPSFMRVLGYPEAELLGKPFIHFVHPDDVAATVQETLALATGKSDAAMSFQNRYRCADGTYRWLEWKSISDTWGNRIYAVARDVTAQKATEQKLEEYTRELERSNGELQQFAYVASHDLQEPLRAVAGCVQMLAERMTGKLDDRSVELMNHTVDGAKRMQTLINDLLAFSRVGSRGITKAWIDPRRAVEKAVKQLQVAITESDAAITIDALPEVSADATQLTQLFQNLIANAIKFREERRPEIHIAAEHENSETIFSVRDNGIGIAPEYHERVFGIFQRLHRRSEYSGTGIGLAICKKIVERHEGRIWIESREGAGACFRFSIPDGKK